MTNKDDHLAAYLNSIHGKTYPKYPKGFEDIAWDEFDFHAVLEILLDPRKSFPKHKEILFEALSAWVIAPHKDELRKNAIRKKVRLAMTAQERRVSAYPPEQQYFQDIYMRMSALGPDFISQVYYPIGGIQSLVGNTTVAGFKKDLQESASAVRSLCKIVEIMHVEHWENRDRRLYWPPSFKRSSDALEAIKEAHDGMIRDGDESAIRYLSASGVRQNLSNHYHGVTVLIYAAQLTQLSGDVTLLDRFRGKRFKLTTKTRIAALKQWLSIAAYLTKDVIVHADNTYLPKASQFLIESIEPFAVGPRAIPKSEKDEIEKKMSKDHFTHPKHKKPSESDDP